LVKSLNNWYLYIKKAMAVIKLKQSDIENIVKKAVMREQYDTGGSFDILGEEEPMDQPDEPGNQPVKTLSMMAGEDGNYYVVDWSDSSNPKIVAKTNK
jgi:hypothetical protein